VLVARKISITTMTLLDASKTVASNIAGDNKVVNFGTGSKIRFGFWFLATCDYQPKTRNQQPATYLLGG